MIYNSCKKSTKIDRKILIKYSLLSISISVLAILALFLIFSLAIKGKIFNLYCIDVKRHYFKYI